MEADLQHSGGQQQDLVDYDHVHSRRNISRGISTLLPCLGKLHWFSRLNIGHPIARLLRWEKQGSLMQYRKRTFKERSQEKMP
mmetsp:Transcript_1532/g.5746  ORF Transcript_1532/g.5746 Transcript_1532/m.5746 type:complete len:83 (-) Transcript_1532:755-1003(-)